MTILELAHHAGLKPKWVASTGGGEYESNCPNCGGDDRFRLWPTAPAKNCQGRYWCRQCAKHGDSIQFARDFLGLSFEQALEKTHATIPQKPLSIQWTYNNYKPAVLKRPPNLWIKKAACLIEHAYQRLLRQRNILDYLQSRGLSREAIQNYKIGWTPADSFHEKDEWGLHEASNKKLWIPKGIIIPTMEAHGDIIRLKVRRFDWKENDELPKYIAISGSMNGLSIMGNASSNIMIVVESELDAYAIHHVAGDFLKVIAVGSCLKNPDNVTDYLAKNTPVLIVCYDNDAAGQKMRDKWQRLYPHARGYSVPHGKDIGEFIEKGGDLKTIIQKIIKKPY